MKARRWIAAACCFASAAAHGHGFGARYDLPLPLPLYLSGAALTVAFSFLLLGLFARRAPQVERRPITLDLLRVPAVRYLASAWVIGTARGVGVALYGAVLFAGLFGNPSPFRNVAPLGIWALWWVGMAYVSALVGDLWRIVNPLDTLFAWAATVLGRGARPAARFQPPPWMAAWPAVALYLVFEWMELVWEGTDSPRLVAAAMVAYSAITWTGMWVFGREAWLARGEVFSLVFGLLGRFAPLHVELEGRRVSRWELRPYAVGLVGTEPLHPSMIVLVVTILAGVSFDGFLETPAWAAIAEGWPDDPESAEVLRSLGVAVAPLLFLAIYMAFSYLIARSAAMHGERRDARAQTARVAGLFVLTLVPIAIAYQVAHYLSYLVTASQYMISIASDPFGWGWNLFGTATHLVHPNIVDARLSWIVSVGAIVAGHVAALYLGHVLAQREFRDPRAAMRSQWPMLVLMVGYTMLSLWIIAQPIVSSR